MKEAVEPLASDTEDGRPEDGGARIFRLDTRALFGFAVRPGMTGPMQVYGRGQLTFEERLAVERDYIENLSIGRDLRLLALTLAAVFGGRGAF